MAHQQQQMTFAQIGTLYNTISNELEGGVTHQNQALLVSQVTTVQTQLQNLINSGALNGIDGAGNAAHFVVGLQHGARLAQPGQFVGGGQTGGPGTDNDDVVGVGVSDLGVIETQQVYRRCHVGTTIGGERC